MPFELLCPIIQVMNLVKQENRCRAGFGVGPTTLPESGRRRVWFISSSVDCGIAKLGGDFKEQCGLANLAGPREKLDSAWCAFSEAFQEEVPTRQVVAYGLRHSRIIIQVYLMKEVKLTPAHDIRRWCRQSSRATPQRWSFRSSQCVVLAGGKRTVPGAPLGLPSEEVV
jgi:hypothetical protein